MSRRRKSHSGRQTGQPASQQKLNWYKVDLHVHTPASRDYEEPGVSYLDWLRQVGKMELDIVAIADHNTVEGVAAIRREIEWLNRLEQDGRLTPEEEKHLKEWRELANRTEVLPGFEFTATFGFHILGIFPPETSIRQLEHVLLSLNVPADKLDVGTTETGASTDVLTAYEVITDAGGMAIAAHANSTHGVAMRNFPFGGQTKIAYTQDDRLIALEVTDLESRSRKSTARFFNGSKPEYARKMHCIQGSDAHRLVMDPKNPKRLGIGERATEMLLPEPTFEAIRELLSSRNFDRIRPYRPKNIEVDHLEAARSEGPNQVQSFHESPSRRGGRQAAILADLCAFANTDGGTVFVGASSRAGKPKGVNPKPVQKELEDALAERLTPPIDVRFETIQSQAAQILRVSVDAGSAKPYCLDGSKFYVRNEAETSLAVRDEIVSLVIESLDIEKQTKQPPQDKRRSRSGRSGGRTGGQSQVQNGNAPESDDPFYLPQNGVEIIGDETRGGTRYYILRDLRNGRSVSNVTRKGARKLWSYAISQYEDNPVKTSGVSWKGNVGKVLSEKRAGKERYDLVLREGKNLRVFYGVTEDGMDGPWAQFVQNKEEA